MARGKIIPAHHLPILTQQAINEIAADEAGGTSDKGLFHATARFYFGSNKFQRSEPASPPLSRRVTARSSAGQKFAPALELESGYERLYSGDCLPRQFRVNLQGVSPRCANLPPFFTFDSPAILMQDAIASRELPDGRGASVFD